MANLVQSRLSLGSIGGIIAVVVGTALGMFLLTQFEFGRRLVGAAAKGTVSTS